MFHCVRQIFRFRAMSREVEIKMFLKLLKPGGRETWAVTEMDMKRLVIWKREMLRSTYGPVVEQGIWRIRNDQELWKVYKDLGIVTDIKRRV